MNLRTVLGFAAGPILTAALSAVTIPVIAWAFSPADVGRLNLLQVFVSFAVLGLALGLDQAYVREFHGSRDRGSLLNASSLPGFAILSLVAILLALHPGQLSTWLYGDDNPAYYWITLTCVAAAYAARFLSLILRMNERALAFSASQVVPKVILIAVTGAVVLANLPHDFKALALSFMLSTVAGLLVLAWWTRADLTAAIHSRFAARTSVQLLRYSVPLMFAAIAYWGFNASSSLVLRTHSSFTELGYYSITTSVAGVAAIAQAIFSMIWAPIVYKWVANGAELARVGLIADQALAVVATLFTLCGTLAWLVDLVLPEQYSGVKYLVAAAIAQPLLYTLSEITGIGVGITRKTTLSLWSIVLALVVNFGLSLALVPHRGASGAIIANAAGYLAFFVARTEVSALVWRSFPRLRLYAVVTAAIVLSILTALAGDRVGYAFNFVWLATAPVVVWLFRHEWRQLWTALRARIAN